MENLLRQIPNIDHDKIIKEYQNDLKQCQKAGEAQAECVILVNQKYIRKFPQMKDLVYPWANYDWDYTTFIDNNYNKNNVITIINILMILKIIKLFIIKKLKFLYN